MDRKYCVRLIITASIVLFLVAVTLRGALSLNETDIDQLRVVIRDELQNGTNYSVILSSLGSISQQITGVNDTVLSRTNLNVSINESLRTLLEERLDLNAEILLRSINASLCGTSEYLNLSNSSLTPVLQQALSDAMSNSFAAGFTDQQQWFRETLLPETQDLEVCVNEQAALQAKIDRLRVDFDFARLEANRTITDLLEDGEDKDGTISTLWWIIVCISIITIASNWDDIRQWTKKY